MTTPSPSTAFSSPAQASEEAAQKIIREALQAHAVVLFMKGDPLQPRCGFSKMVVDILQHLGARFESVNVLESPDMRQAIKVFSNWPTIPQLYVRGEFIGGCDIVREMFETGELASLLKAPAVAASDA